MPSLLVSVAHHTVTDEK